MANAVFTRALEVREAATPSAPRAFRYSFEVAPDVRSIVLRASYEALHWLYAIVRDADGNVRMQYLAKKRPEVVVLQVDGASCSIGSVPGPIPAGAWTLEAVAYPPPEGGAFAFELDVFESDVDAAALSTVPLTVGEPWLGADGEVAWDGARVVREGARWYKGDFHMHTLLSDGKQTPAQLAKLAADRQGLDFIVVTEHNLVHAAWPAVEGLLAIPGVEITGNRGHWNALGLRRWLPFLDETGALAIEDDEGMNRTLASGRAQGALRSLNHPYLAPWDWLLEGTDMTRFEAMEIWNDPTYDGNAEAAERALEAWDRCWARGLRLTGVGGSDTHMLPEESYAPGGPPSIVGDPATYVYSDGLSADAVLGATRAGRCYVSRGPTLDFRIEANGRRALPGDVVSDADDASGGIALTYVLTVASDQAEPLLVAWYENGVRLRAEDLPPGGGVSSYEASWEAGAYRWLRAEVRTTSGELLAFVNPISAYPPATRPTAWRDVRYA
ncbi:CehA/McbA family metallohydrolase [Paenibacillus sp. TRM 82003]|nr:CehA/McbA family metallohydrolase [Paenibacillus sp. TRM 82003]